MEKIEVQKLAERIALLLQENEQKTDDFTFLRDGIEKINARLDTLETKLNRQDPNNTQPSSVYFQPVTHPSRQKFEIPEAISNEMNLIDETEKPCPYEPTGKLCDHCSMCSSLGF